MRTPLLVISKKGIKMSVDDKIKKKKISKCDPKIPTIRNAFGEVYRKENLVFPLPSTSIIPCKVNRKIL